MVPNDFEPSEEIFKCTTTRAYCPIIHTVSKGQPLSKGQGQNICGQGGLQTKGGEDADTVMKQKTLCSKFVIFLICNCLKEK